MPGWSAYLSIAIKVDCGILSDKGLRFLSLGIFKLVTVFEKNVFKVGLSRSKKICVICFTESPLKMMNNVFYSILKALFVLEIFKFLSGLFGHLEKIAWLER